MAVPRVATVEAIRQVAAAVVMAVNHQQRPGNHIVRDYFRAFQDTRSGVRVVQRYPDIDIDIVKY